MPLTTERAYLAVLEMEKQSKARRRQMLKEEREQAAKEQAAWQQAARDSAARNQTPRPAPMPPVKEQPIQDAVKPQNSYGDRTEAAKPLKCEEFE